MNLFTENMAQFNEYTSQSLQIKTKMNLITFQDYETLLNELEKIDKKKK